MVSKLRGALVFTVFLTVAAQAADPPILVGRRKSSRSTRTNTSCPCRRMALSTCGIFSGAHIFDNVLRWCAWWGRRGRERVLRTHWEQSARALVDDALGEGQGLVFAGDDFEWHIHTYPSKPYLSAQPIFINKDKEAVQVARLTPWSVGSAGAGGLSLGTGTKDAFVLDNGRLFRGFDDFAAVSQGSAFGNWNIAAYNPASGRSLIAGFLSNRRAYRSSRSARRKRRRRCPYFARTVFTMRR